MLANYIVQPAVLEESYSRRKLAWSSIEYSRRKWSAIESNPRLDSGHDWTVVSSFKYPLGNLGIYGVFGVTEKDLGTKAKSIRSGASSTMYYTRFLLPIGVESTHETMGTDDAASMKPLEPLVQEKVESTHETMGTYDVASMKPVEPLVQEKNMNEYLYILRRCLCNDDGDSVIAPLEFTHYLGSYAHDPDWPVLSGSLEQIVDGTYSEGPKAFKTKSWDKNTKYMYYLKGTGTHWFCVKADFERGCLVVLDSLTRLSTIDDMRRYRGDDLVGFLGISAVERLARTPIDNTIPLLQHLRCCFYPPLNDELFTWAGHPNCSAAASMSRSGNGHHAYRVHHQKQMHFNGGSGNGIQGYLAITLLLAAGELHRRLELTGISSAGLLRLMHRGDAGDRAALFGRLADFSVEKNRQLGFGSFN
ncbi:unnamed protein product [Cuscuta campestris]|uniref:Uncharacterized protein n=1 Tax=Cuscuta campestris TaxID=132261 RepID=A0A484L007_9ASTE|nr:unnamed protein product [Cuscuta campestris]